MCPLFANISFNFNLNFFVFFFFFFLNICLNHLDIYLLYNLFGWR